MASVYYYFIFYLPICSGGERARAQCTAHTVLLLLYSSLPQSSIRNCWFYIRFVYDDNDAILCVCVCAHTTDILRTLYTGCLALIGMREMKLVIDK